MATTITSRRPTHKPTLSLARALRDDVYKITFGAPLKWIMVGDLCPRHPRTPVDRMDAALAFAIAKGWMTGEGTPVHSVCLTDAGRRLGGS